MNEIKKIKKGVYIPFFAYSIHNFNLQNKGNASAYINLKGNFDKH